MQLAVLVARLGTSSRTVNVIHGAWVGHTKQRTKDERRLEHVRVCRMSKRTVGRGQTGHGSFNSAANPRTSDPANRFCWLSESSGHPLSLVPLLVTHSS